MTAWFTVASTHALAIRAAEERPSLISHGFRPSSWYYATAWSLVRGSISPMETSGRNGGYRLTGASAACAESTEGFVFFGVV